MFFLPFMSPVFFNSSFSSQFLPQDRVAHFASLSPIQPLHETQRAVGGDEMVAHWERLCGLRAQERDLQNVLTSEEFIY